jgi:hypothetical protein
MHPPIRDPHDPVRRQDVHVIGADLVTVVRIGDMEGRATREQLGELAVVAGREVRN